MGDHDRYPVVLPQTPDRPVHMPPILFPCPYCNTEVKARGDWGNKTTTCLGCGNKVIVPLPLPVPPSAPAPIPRGRTVDVDSEPIPLASFVRTDRPRSHSRSLWLMAAGVLAAVVLGAAGMGAWMSGRPPAAEGEWRYVTKGQVVLSEGVLNALQNYVQAALDYEHEATPRTFGRLTEARTQFRVESAVWNASQKK